MGSVTSFSLRTAGVTMSVVAVLAAAAPAVAQEQGSRQTREFIQAAAQTDQSMFLASLQSQRGADFDKTYLKQQVLAHHAALATEQGYATSGDNAAIRQVAAATVPVVTHHLQMAEQLKAASFPE